MKNKIIKVLLFFIILSLIVLSGCVKREYEYVGTVKEIESISKGKTQIAALINLEDGQQMILMIDIRDNCLKDFKGKEIFRNKNNNIFKEYYIKMGEGNFC